MPRLIPIENLNDFVNEHYPIQTETPKRVKKWDGVTWDFEPQEYDRRDRSFHPDELRTQRDEW